MIVEFIGSTGAGKTTLISEVRRKLDKTQRVTSSFEVVAAPYGLRSVKKPTARNLIQEIIGLPYFVLSLHRHRAFVVNYLRLLARQDKFTIFMMNNLRSLVRKIGVYEILKRNNRDQIILVDEGTVLSAHHVFVFTSVVYTPQEIARFASMLQLPDVIIYVRVPLENLIERSLERKDPPRMMRSRDRVQNEHYIRRAVSMFELLLANEQIRNRTLIVDNPDASEKELDKTIDNITDFILNHDLIKNKANSSYLTTLHRTKTTS